VLAMLADESTQLEPYHRLDLSVRSAGPCHIQVISAAYAEEEGKKQSSWKTLQRNVTPD